jgi:hypothetical protein
VPYKLPALLRSRLGTPGHARETLFGDDAESDAIVYSLYADILGGRLGRTDVEKILDAADAYDDQRADTLGLVEKVPHGDVVKRIIIHLDRRSPTAGFERFGDRLVAVFNYFQAAVILYGDGELGAEDVLRVAREMLASGDYTLASLANSLQDLIRRNRLPRALAAKLALECQEAVGGHPADWADLPPKEEIAWAFATRVKSLGPLWDDPSPPPDGNAGAPVLIDYEALIREDRARRKDR